jgi:hypothetical protein
MWKYILIVYDRNKKDFELKKFILDDVDLKITIKCLLGKHTRDEYAKKYGREFRVYRCSDVDILQDYWKYDTTDKDEKLDDWGEV